MWACDDFTFSMHIDFEIPDFRFVHNFFICRFVLSSESKSNRQHQRTRRRGGTEKSSCFPFRCFIGSLSLFNDCVTFGASFVSIAFGGDNVCLINIISITKSILAAFIFFPSEWFRWTEPFCDILKWKRLVSTERHCERVLTKRKLTRIPIFNTRNVDFRPSIRM